MGQDPRTLTGSTAAARYKSIARGSEEGQGRTNWMDIVKRNLKNGHHPGRNQGIK